MATQRESTVSLEKNSSEDHLSVTTLKTIEQFDEERGETQNSSCCCCCSCLDRWWNCQYAHQRFIVHIVEKTAFHVGIIVLVLIDCLFVVGELMLDFISLNEKCSNKTRHSPDGETRNHELELAIEVLHYGSVILLSLFVVEVLVKIYAFGKKWWDIREKKMEWLDALIVIVSFIVDLYFMRKPSAIAEISLLFISFRLWRIIRIINSVAQSVRSKDEQGKRHLISTYIQIVELLLEVSAKKTHVATELRQNFTMEGYDKLLERFTSVDQSCRTILAHCQTPTSKSALADMTQNLQETLEQIRLSSTKLNLTNHSKTS